MTLLIAIDGPAGTGKSSVAKALAKKLNYIYVDTGAIYRGLALLVFNHGLDPENPTDILKVISKLNIKVDDLLGVTNIYIDNKHVEKELRTLNIGNLSSRVSRHKEVREALLGVQRDLLNNKKNGWIFEGRDIGSVVFPKAQIKLFITANTETRAKRRFDELINQGQKVNFEEVYKAIKERDEADEKRAIAPLLKAKDAITVDTSNLTKEQVTDKIIKLIEKVAKNEQTGERPW